MNNRNFLLGAVALMQLAIGCSQSDDHQSSTDDLSFEEQLLAALPVLDQGAVLKICNTNTQTGDHGNLSFSFVAERPDPSDPGKTIQTDPATMDKQLSTILQLVDEQHALNIQRETDAASGLPHFVFPSTAVGTG